MLFLYKQYPICSMVPRFFLSRVLYRSRDAVENSNRDLPQYHGNYAGPSQLVPNPDISMYGFGRFEQSYFDKVFRLV